MGPRVKRTAVNRHWVSWDGKAGVSPATRAQPLKAGACRL